MTTATREEKIEAVARAMCSTWGYSWDGDREFDETVAPETCQFETPGKSLYREAAEAALTALESLSPGAPEGKEDARGLREKIAGLIAGATTAVPVSKFDPEPRERLFACVDAILALLSPVPPGFVLVPREALEAASPYVEAAIEGELESTVGHFEGSPAQRLLAEITALLTAAPAGFVLVPREALTKLRSDLTCRAYDGQDSAHYCPNCDNSFYNQRAAVDALLTAAPSAPAKEDGHG